MAKSKNPLTPKSVPSRSSNENSDRPVNSNAKPVSDAASGPTRQERLRAIAEDAERRLKGSMKLLS
jgi:hypothetical protein